MGYVTKSTGSVCSVVSHGIFALISRCGSDKHIRPVLSVVTQIKLMLTKNDFNAHCCIIFPTCHNTSIKLRYLEPTASPRSFVWGGGGFIGNQAHPPTKFSFSSDSDHFILKTSENAKFAFAVSKNTGGAERFTLRFFSNISVICKGIKLIFCTYIHEHVHIQATVVLLDTTSLCLHHSLETPHC